MRTKHTFPAWIIANLESFIFLYFVVICVLRIVVSKSEITEIDALTEIAHIKTIGIFIAFLATIGTIFITIFTWKHFDEVVSLRMLWRNSRVALFQMRLFYVISRSLMGILTIGLTLVLIYIFLFILVN